MWLTYKVSNKIDLKDYNGWYSQVNNVKKSKVNTRTEEKVLYGLNEPLSNDIIYRTKYKFTIDMYNN